jgi:hypothetical protein
MISSFLASGRLWVRVYLLSLWIVETKKPPQPQGVCEEKRFRRVSSPKIKTALGAGENEKRFNFTDKISIGTNRNECQDNSSINFDHLFSKKRCPQFGQLIFDSLSPIFQVHPVRTAMSPRHDARATWTFSLEACKG